MVVMQLLICPIQILLTHTMFLINLFLRKRKRSLKLLNTIKSGYHFFLNLEIINQNIINIKYCLINEILYILYLAFGIGVRPGCLHDCK